ncbi:hypothetical protein [Bacteroides graminisolvens]|uniref:hypothetical protein n=1 Tax=Bacteroides graminisolvens TaxID=477666 RepID=UPI0023F4110E|nr:hypothetical protein [Bacteroides graminisolvens]MDD3211474.1 hypothetical protein [Bacteroides graminisolvens]MDD4418972.1 hypothetical protein [Bacteroides graminisolvens]
MKKNIYFWGICIFLTTSCSNDNLNELIETSEPEKVSSEISLKNGYLNFRDEGVLEDYLEQVKGDNITSRSSSSNVKISGFTSIADLKSNIVSRSLNDDTDEDMTKDEFNIMKAENLIIDEDLAQVMDTTLRIGVNSRFYKITNYGTFSTESSDIANIDIAIEKFDTTLVANTKRGEYVDLGNGVTFINSFGIGSLCESSSEILEEDNAITSRAATYDNNLQSEYNCKDYKWKNDAGGFFKTLFGLAGTDVSKENNFNSKRRVQVNVFDINYGFYTSAGIKVKMQKRKKILFVKYWVSETADKLAIGFNNIEGEMKYSTPYPFSSLVPEMPSQWSKFTGQINGITADFIYGIYKKIPYVKDWVNEIYVCLPKVTIINNTYPNVSLMNSIYSYPAKEANSLLKKSVINKWVYSPIKKFISPKDPIMFNAVWGVSSIKYNKERPLIMGVQEYGSGSSKTVRFNRSFGFSINNGAVSGFTPTEFDIKKIDAFGAAYYDNQWKGVRFYKN